MIIEFGTYGSRTVEPTEVPVIRFTGTKYCDFPGAANHIKALAVPGVVIFTGSLAIANPVPKRPTWLIGDGLHVDGWQTAYTEAAPANAVETAPPAPTV